MPPRNELLKERNSKIFHRYKELYDINYLRHERVLELLSKEFYLLPKTLELIVLNEKKEIAKIDLKNKYKRVLNG